MRRWLCGAVIFLAAALPLVAQNIAITVRHAPTINGNGRVEGSVQELLGESVTLNGGATLTQDLLVPGVPTVQTNGSVSWQGVQAGAGAATPTGYTVLLNGNVALRYVRTRTNATTIPSVPAPPTPTGTRSVTINQAGQSAGDWTTLRDLTLNGNVGQVAVPAGTYRNFTANGGSGFTLGVAGAAQPAIYSFQSLTLNGQTTINVVGPVILQLANGLSANGQAGVTAHPEWLQIKISNGGVTLNGGSTIYGSILAPSGQLIINGQSTLVGTAMCDRFTLNGGGLVKWANTSAGSGNQPPIATAQSVSTAEDVAKAITLAATDADGNALTFAAATQPAHGTVSGSGANVTYTPFLNYFGPDSFTFAANDGTVNSQPATVTITVTSVNDAPVAQAQAVSATEDAPALLTLMGTDADGDALTYAITTAPAHGALSGTAPNLTYTPAPNYNGPDSFVFKVNDGQLNSALATVTINVAPVEDVPVVGPLNIITPEDQWVNIALTGFDADGEPLVFHVASAPQHGVLTGTLPNLVYTPAANYHGPDSFTYYASDPYANSAVATVSINVTPVNDAPVAAPRLVLTDEDTAAAFTLPASDVDGDALTYQITAAPTHGTISGIAPNLLYTPAPNFFGTDSLTFVAHDATSASAPAVIGFTVRAVNDAPVANPQVVALNEDTPATVLLTATEVDGDPLHFTVLTQPLHGTLAATANPAAFLYTPAANYNGSDSFTFKANDGTVDSAPATVTLAIAPVRDVPIAQPFAFATPEDHPAAVTLTGIDYDGLDLTFTIIQPPAHGTLTGSGAERTYTPARDYNGPDSFRYVAGDSFGDSSPATVPITVTPVNDAPVAAAQSLNIAEDTIADITLAATDVENDTLTFRVVTQPAHGTLTPGASGATVHYSPFSNYNGPDGFAFVANDGQLDSAAATVEIAVTPRNDAPVAQPATFTTREDTSLAIALQGSDVDGDTLTFAPTAPAHGSLAPGALPGTYLYTPVADYHGPDAFTFTVNDGLASSAPAAVSLEIAPVNDPPTIQVTAPAQVTAPTAITLHAVATDDGDPVGSVLTVRWSKVSGPGDVAFTNAASADTTASYTLAGTYVLRATASDGELSASANATVVVAMPNQSPDVSAGVTQTVAPAAPANLLGTVHDDGLPQGGTITQQWSKLSGPGTVAFGSATALASTATFSAPGDYVLRLRASDSALSGQAEVTIHVLAPNQPPQVSAGLAQSTVLGTAATLTGNVTDDGLPRGAGLQTQWSKVSGPGGVTFSDPFATGTTVQFTAAGLYTLRLTASDSALTGSAEVQVTVAVPENHAPIVNAGPDLTLTGTTSTPIAGSAADDGLPAGSVLNLGWSKFSGPGSVSFNPPATAATVVNFGASGTYVLRLTATDGALNASDEVTVTVATPNRAPVVHAGSDQTISGGLSALLAGLVSDDGLTAGGPLGIAWSKVSGPGTVTFADPARPATTATFTAAGSYVLRLTANDGEFTAQDDVQIILGTGGAFSVTLSSPLPGEVCGAPANLLVAADVQGGTLPLASVEFFANGQKIGQSSTAPYTFNWNDVPPGSYTLTAVARDAAGVTAVSPPVIAQITPLAENLRGLRWEFPAGAEIPSIPGASVVSATSSDQVVFAGDPGKLYRIALRFRGIVELRSFDNGTNDGYYWQTGGTPGSADPGGNRYHLKVVNPQGQVTAVYSLNRNYLGIPYVPNPYEAIPTYAFPLDYTRSIEVPGGSTLRLDAFSEDNQGGNNRTGIVVPGVPPAPSPYYGQFVQMDALSAAESALSPTTLQVDAGPDLAATLPDGLALNGIVSGVPANAVGCETPRVFWSKLIGPGQITFDPPEAAQTNAHFSRPGIYVLEFNAVVHGAVATDRVTLTITPPPGVNQPPVVSAGADQSSATSPASLHGFVSDDDRPTVSGVTSSWSVVSGPGDGLFSPQDRPDSKVTFTRTGSYVLRLTSSDGELTASDEVTVNVTGLGAPLTAPSGIVAWWPGENSTNDAISGLAAEALTGSGYCPGLVSQGFALSGLDSGIRATATTYGSSLDIGTRDGMTVECWIKPERTDRYYQPIWEWNDGATYGAHMYLSDPNFGGLGGLVVNLVDRNGGNHILAAGPGLIAAGHWHHVAVTYDRASQRERLYLDGRMLQDVVAGNFVPRTNSDFGIGFRPNTSFAFQGCIDEPALYGRALSQAEIQAIIQAGPAGKFFSGGNAAPIVSAGPDVTSATLGSVTLSGSATDDGLPAGSTLAVTWSQVSGPGTAVFGDAGAAATAATFSTDGIYILRLSATDGALAGSDDVIVRVGQIPPNQAPVVHAGPDLAGGSGQTLVLNGTVTDEGLPAGVLYSQWNVLSGPASVNLPTPGQPHTTAIFAAPGTYLLRLSATDGELTASDEVTITIAAGTNQAPVVVFGGPRSVAYGQTLTLTPQITDDDLPDGLLTLRWRQTGGPAALHVMPQADGSAQVTAGAAGVYHLLLSASDGVLTGSDEVVITVTPVATVPPVVALTAPGGGASFPHGQALTLQASASDPDTGGGIVSIAFYDGATLLGTDSAPDAAGHAQFNWTGASTGTHTLTAKATDVSGTTAASAPVAVTVTPARPLVALSYPFAYSAFAPGDAVQVQATASPGGDGSAITQVEFLVNGSVVGVDPSAPFATGWTAPAAPGDYTLTARATDTAGQTATSGSVLVRVVTDPSAPLVVELDLAQDGATITAPTPLYGTVSGPTLVSWKVEYRRAGSDCGEWVTLAVGAQSVAPGGLLGTLDPTKLLNGIYDVRLTARDAFGGLFASAERVVVEGDMKVGHFTVAFADMQVSLAGLPLTVTRMYDSRERCPGDFGNGWKLDVDSIRLEKSHALGEAWSMGVTVGNLSTPSTYQLTDDGPHLLTVRMPDGEVLRFAPKLVMSRAYSRLASLLDGDGDDVGQAWLPIQYGQPLRLLYRPRGGTKGATLTARGYRAADPFTGAGGTIAGDAPLYVSEPYEGPISLATNENSAQDAALITDATGWELTAKDGRKFFFAADGRLESMRDPQGNTLTILRDGAGRIQKVTHSSGKQITFVRNGDGFIEQVIDPAGNSCHYAYDAGGDLRAFYDRTTDPATQSGTQQFSYTAGTHYLTDLFDGKGVRAAKNYYDNDGRLYRTVDAQGKETVFTHNVAGRTETIKDRAGNITSYTYDTRGNVTETALPDGTRMTTGYHVWSDGRLSELKEVETVTGLFSDGAGGLVPKTLTTHYAYEDDGVPPVNDGLLRKVTDPLGHSTYFAYDGRGSVLAVTDPLGHTTTNAYYPGTTLPQSTTDAEGNVTGFTYDAHGLLDKETRTVTVTDAAGATAVQTLVTDYDYDASGYLTRMTDARGHATTYDNDPHGNRLFERTTRTLNGGVVPVVTEHAYDANDRLVKTWDAEHPRGGGFNPASETVYDENGKPSVVYDALRRMTQMTYSTRGELQATSYTDGTSTSATYDSDGRREFSYDRRGKAVQTVYDALGRVSESWFIGSVGDTAVRLSHADYDAAGRVWKSTDANSHTTTYSYDNAGRRSAVRNAKGELSQYAYDDAGNARFFTDARGQTVESVYDLVNRRVRTVFPVSAIVEGSTVRSVATEAVTLYDELGRRVQEFEQSPVDAAFAARRSKRYVYDALGRLGAVVDAAGQATSYTYDELGNQLTQTDANQHTTGYSYDHLGRRKSRTLPGGQAEGLHYDSVGNMDAHVDFNGTTATYGYDPLNRLLTRTVAQASGGAIAAPVGYTYTLSGRRATMTDASGVTTYHYDARDRLASKATPEGTLTYGYDDGGNLASIVSGHAQGASVSYGYDELNRLNAVNDTHLGATSYAYDEVGNMVSCNAPNGTAHAYAYNAVNRLTSMALWRNPVVGTPSVLASYTYTIAANGQRASAAESGAGILPANPTGTRSVAYQYDNLLRLTHETITGDPGHNGTASYNHDAVGNRQSRTSSIAGLTGQSFTYDANDRLNTDTYDANGNTKTGKVSLGATGAETTPSTAADTYDSENRLIARTGPNSVQVIYDGDGNKVRETLNGQTVSYLIDTLNPTGYAQVIEELSNGTPIRTYTYGHDLIAQDQRDGTGAWSATFYGYDGHGSVRQLTNDQGNLTDTYTYDAFGTLLATAGATFNRYRYCGEQYDEALGLYYLRARLMNPLTGRFWSADSFEGSQRDPQSLHKYLYANADPVNGRDRSGHWSIVSVTVSVAVAAIVVTGIVYAYHKYYTLNPDRNPDTAYAVTVIPHLPFVMYGSLYYQLSRPARHVIEMHELQHVNGMSGSDDSHRLIAQQMKVLIEDMLVNGSWGNRPLTDEEIVDLMQVWLLHDQADDNQSIKQSKATHLETKIEIRAPGLWERQYKNDWEAAEQENYSKYR